MHCTDKVRSRQRRSGRGRWPGGRLVLIWGRGCARRRASPPTRALCGAAAPYRSALVCAHPAGCDAHPLPGSATAFRIPSPRLPPRRHFPRAADGGLGPDPAAARHGGAALALRAPLSRIPSRAARGSPKPRRGLRDGSGRGRRDAPVAQEARHGATAAVVAGPGRVERRKVTGGRVCAEAGAQLIVHGGREQFAERGIVVWSGSIDAILPERAKACQEVQHPVERQGLTRRAIICLVDRRLVIVSR